MNDNLIQNEKIIFKEGESKIDCTWKSIWCIKIYDPTDTVNESDIIKVCKQNSAEFRKLGCLLLRDKNLKFFHPIYSLDNYDKLIWMK